MTVVMYDDVTVSLIPPDAPAVAGYVTGSFRNFDQVMAGFPHAHHLGITPTASVDADCLDCEPGDVPPTAFDEIAGWIRRQLTRHVVPRIYCSLSPAQQIVDALAARGLVYGTDYMLWTAHYTMQEHLCSPACGFGFRETAHATQWTDRALGRSLDQSLCQDSFFGIAPPPPKPPRPEDYMSIAIGELQGVPHVFVEAKDGSIFYTYQPKGGKAWEGGKPGHQIAGLVPFAPAPK